MLPLAFTIREYYPISMDRIEKSIDIGTIIRIQRKNLGLTQVEAAGLCGVGVRFWSELENGKETLHLEKVLSVLLRLGIDLKAEVRS